MTPEQLELRRNLVTCSRLPAILEIEGFPIDAYNDMVFGSQESTPAMEAGNDHEPAILKKFARYFECNLDIPVDGYYANGRLATFIYPEKIKHPLTAEEVNYFGGTPDSILSQNSKLLQECFEIDRDVIGAPVQAKCVTHRKALEWGDSIVGEPPKRVIAQVIGEIIVARAELKTDIDFGFVVALIGEPTMADYRYYCVRLDGDLEKIILDESRKFWNIVQRRDPTALSSGGDWSRFVNNQYPRAEVEKIKDEDGSFGVLWNKLRQINEKLSPLLEAKKGIEQLVKLDAETAGAIYGDPSLGKNGLLFTYKNDAPRKETDWDAVIKGLVGKRNQKKYEKLVAEHTKEVPGSRRFLAKGMNVHKDE